MQRAAAILIEQGRKNSQTDSETVHAALDSDLVSEDDVDALAEVVDNTLMIDRLTR